LLWGLWILIGSPYLRAEGNTDLLSIVRAGHRAAREAIYSFSATVTIERTHPQQATIETGKYWRSFDVVRIQEGLDSGGDDYLLKDSEIRQVGRALNPKDRKYRYVATRKPPTDFFCLSDVWSRMMIDFAGPDGGRYSYDRFLEFAKGPPQLRRETMDGRECIRLAMTFENAAGSKQDITLWHDVGYNYLARKMIVKFRSTGGRAFVENVEFLEAAPGVFLPTKCQRQVFRSDGKQVNGDLTTLSDVRVNQPISQEVFRLPAIPAGTVCKDWVQGTKYPVDGSWRPIGPSEPLLRYAAPTQGDDGGEYRSQSTEEPKPLSRWIIPASLVVLTAAGVLWLYRRWRSAKRLVPQ
jgi:hypothetical protein